MKATVLSAYTDRLDGKVHLVGETVELTAERGEELAGKGIVELAAQPKAASKATAKKPATKRTATKKVASA